MTHFLAATSLGLGMLVLISVIGMAILFPLLFGIEWLQEHVAFRPPKVPLVWRERLKTVFMVLFFGAIIIGGGYGMGSDILKNGLHW